MTPAPAVAAIVDRSDAASIAIGAHGRRRLDGLPPAAVAGAVDAQHDLVARRGRRLLLRLAPIPALTLELPGASRLAAVPVPRAASRAGGRPPPPAPASTAAAADPGVLARLPTRVASRVGRSRLADRRFVPLPAPTMTAGIPSAPIDWRTPLVVLWAAIAARAAASARASRRGACGAWPRRRIRCPTHIAAEVEQLAGAPGPAAHAGRARCPRPSRRRRSSACSGPPCCCRPATLDALTPRERAMTLCHELAHVRRLRSRLRLGAGRHGAPAVLPPRSPAGGARICVRARSRLRRRRAAAPRRSATRLRPAPPPPRGHPAARRARRGAVVALDAAASKETRHVERSRTRAPRGPRALAGWRVAPAAGPAALAGRPPDGRAAAGLRGGRAPVRERMRANRRSLRGMAGGMEAARRGRRIRRWRGRRHRRRPRCRLGGVGRSGVGAGIGAGVGSGMSGGIECRGPGTAASAAAAPATGSRRGTHRPHHRHRRHRPEAPRRRRHRPLRPHRPARRLNTCTTGCDGGRDGRTIVLFDGDGTSVFPGSSGDAAGRPAAAGRRQRAVPLLPRRTARPTRRGIAS